MTDCLIVGGGLAGLSAAVEMSGRGIGVTLIEARPGLGGRAYSFWDDVYDCELDNGQHLMLGCYTATRRLLELTGATNTYTTLSRMRIPFRRPDGRTAVLETGGLPHPVGIVQAFLGYGFLTGREKFLVLRMAIRLRRLRADALDALDVISAKQWLLRQRQSLNSIEVLWSPIVLATMNTDVGTASAKLFVTVLREMFLGSAEASALMLPSRGLSQVFADPIEKLVRDQGATILPHETALSLQRNYKGGLTATLKSGRELDCRACISALPPWSLDTLLSRSDLPEISRPPLESFQPAQIISIHLWVKRDLGFEYLEGLLGGTIQWIFAKGRDAHGLYRYSCTISATGLSDIGVIRNLVRRELLLFYKRLSAEDIAAMKVIREKRATYRPVPGLERGRPGTRTALPMFFLAGDWTAPALSAPALPATIEGAVRSGFAAGDSAVEYLSRLEF